jgi:hypothetical protein
MNSCNSQHGTNIDKKKQKIVATFMQVDNSVILPNFLYNDTELLDELNQAE